MPPNPWDAVAGVQLVRAAGGVVTDVHGDRWTVDSDGLIASNGRAHERLVEAVGADD
ncbi:inositol monophosphatase family protein [Natronoarchaeum mannanilyticum]|uniref:inositol monophosphatase family protein n=1 Tax=Natronoarchaeum mannanilyticum TaxID=926360 RepID=UPI003620828E